MKIIELDLTGCTSLYDIHEKIRVAFDFPDWYGKNLDAFWDCISCDCDVDFVTVIGSKNIADNLKETMAKILEMLEENKQEWADSDCPFDYEIIS